MSGEKRTFLNAGTPKQAVLVNEEIIQIGKDTYPISQVLSVEMKPEERLTTLKRLTSLFGVQLFNHTHYSAWIRTTVGEAKILSSPNPHFAQLLVEAIQEAIAQSQGPIPNSH